MFDILVIGAGLIGSAATRYLSETGQKIAVIGASEPENFKAHQGVFASHYDAGRITRVLDPDLIWGTLAKRSIEQYAKIEQASGIRFHYPVGCLRFDTRAAEINKVQRIGEELGGLFQVLNDEGLQKQFPYLQFDESGTGLSEAGAAGYVNPRALVRAQLKVAVNQGATLIRETVQGINTSKERVAVQTAEGNTYSAHKVLIAAGGFTNLILGHPLDLCPKPETILLAEISDSEADRLRDMPSLIYDSPESGLNSIYVLPPIQYPDGKTYIKLGGHDGLEHYLHTSAELQEWFHSDGDKAHVETLKFALHHIIPSLQVETYQSKPCIITYTPSNYPMIGALADDNLYVVAGGNGVSAKSSNEIGRLAASLVHQGVWSDSLDSNLFQLKFR